MDRLQTKGKQKTGPEKRFSHSPAFWGVIRDSAVSLECDGAEIVYLCLEGPLVMFTEPAQSVLVGSMQTRWGRVKAEDKEQNDAGMEVDEKCGTGGEASSKRLLKY